ncbi:hypothetical protein NO386_25885 [Escherichia coli]|nr:hypothetical protein [Escherichia coli]
MKSFIFVLCFAFSAAVYAQEDSISVINSSAELACKNNPDAASKRVMQRAAPFDGCFCF